MEKDAENLGCNPGPGKLDLEKAEFEKMAIRGSADYDQQWKNLLS